MEVDYGNFVTAPGDSDPQVPAVVSGSRVKAGFTVAGSLRSSSSVREGTGVASLAFATLHATSVEEASRGLIGQTRTDDARLVSSVTAKPPSKTKMESRTNDIKITSSGGSETQEAAIGG